MPRAEDATVLKDKNYKLSNMNQQLKKKLNEVEETLKRAKVSEERMKARLKRAVGGGSVKKESANDGHAEESK